MKGWTAVLSDGDDRNDGLRRQLTSIVGEGLPIAMVAARAGHSSPNVTLGTCSHYMPGQQASAVQSVARFSRKGAR